MAFDSAIISFTTKTDKVDLVQAAHMNAVQNELVTIETILGSGVKGTQTNLVTRLSKALDADGSILSGTSFPSPALTSQLFYRTDLGFLYVFTGAWSLVGSSVSNVLFYYQASVDVGNTLGSGEIQGTDLSTDVTSKYRYWQNNSTSYTTMWTTKWIKISGVTTITVYVQLWQSSGGGSETASCKVIVGSVNGEVTSGTVISPTWYNFTIDVSSLSNGTAYDVTVQIKHTGAGVKERMGTLIAFGS